MVPSGYRDTINDQMALETAFQSTDGDRKERTLADRAFAQIHNAIVSGDLAPGERLPIEELGERLGMSPMPIREALRQLDNVGLVQNVPHRGAAVRELSLEDLKGLYEARLALEPLAIKHAAERCTEDDAVSIRNAFLTLKALGSSGASADGWVAHRKFHYALYRAARSEWLTRLITPLWESSQRYRLATPVKWTLERRSSEHEAMLEATVAHEPEKAAAILHDHLATTANEVARDMGEGDLFELINPSAMAKLEAPTQPAS